MVKSCPTAYHTQANGVVEIGHNDLGYELSAMRLEGDNRKVSP